MQNVLNNINNEFMSPLDLKNFLGLSIPTQAKMRYRKGCFANDPNPLPFIKLGGRVFYKKSSILEWLDKNENKELKGE
ncbi:hypothetical protein O6B72_07945 [Campylobacter ureolyticus]|uniref:helix-turn-helix domain-containing protein n=1 Tax=Campylobacter ureolyticus TaxID=827 RepID=UPI0022B34B32|nr:hypothetical protein [Campylobacter ureolyticus]MCZ6156735.1 hypothetical protein [Campylobacter ureolyticus]